MFPPPLMCYGLSMKTRFHLDTETATSIGYVLIMLAVFFSVVLGACGDSGGEDPDMCRLPEFVPGPLDYRTCECGEWADACDQEGYACTFVPDGTLCVKQCQTDDECPKYENFAAECLSHFCSLPCAPGCPDGMVCGGINSTGCVWERQR